MPGTKEGGIKARNKNLEKNPNFYAEIGAKGGHKSTTGGFWHTKYVKGDIEAIRAAGLKGGLVRGENYKTRKGHYV